ncbi:Glutaminase [Nostoc flagelliforme CCNUN1]|uniref:glutaminase n=1 Tax=Nostoc flagelliforme CCNUN1 TaxID=2038116 RepID=A0A2K8SFU6_9NOSO|nr:Glutaminase [Nostoc flagelliforme CCNUN1]
MKGLKKLTTTELLTWIQQAKIQVEGGQVAHRIPQLAKANPGWFAIHICCESGKTITFGDIACVFPLISVIKTFSLLS